MTRSHTQIDSQLGRYTHTHIYIYACMPAASAPRFLLLLLRRRRPLPTTTPAAAVLLYYYLLLLLLLLLLMLQKLAQECRLGVW